MIPSLLIWGDGHVNYAFYRNSYLLKQVRYYPIIQFAIIGLFLLIAYYAFSTSRRIEQNQVWVGMAKETAHQLGTPISSLAGWMEIMKEHKVNEEWVSEMEKDMMRLETITDRFSKIGSTPSLVAQNVVTQVKESLDYFSKRISNNISLSLSLPDGDRLMADISPPLFKWVLENLIKNSLDAMSEKGSIAISVGSKTVRFILMSAIRVRESVSQNIRLFSVRVTAQNNGVGVWGCHLPKELLWNTTLAKYL